MCRRAFIAQKQFNPAIFPTSSEATMPFDFPPCMQAFIMIEIVVTLIALLIWAIHDLDRGLESRKQSRLKLAAPAIRERQRADSGKTAVLARRRERRE
jgi:hypothetical protein